MNLLLSFITISAIILMATALLQRHRLIGLERENQSAKEKIRRAEAENEHLHKEISSLTTTGGISESSVLSLIGDISRIENNLYHMQEVPGRKQVAKAVERMKVALQAEGYTVVPLLGTEYREGMQVTAVFVPNENLPEGTSLITSVQRPQVNHSGRMIQAGSVTVAQNV